jgi:hypothetical protein
MSNESTGRPVAVLKAGEMDRTIEWYEAAGFSVRERVDDPGASWCEVAREGTVLQFLAGATPWAGRPALTGCIYVHVTDIDQAFAALRAPVEPEWGIEDREWGAREVVLEDPNGYFIALSQPPPSS